MSYSTLTVPSITGAPNKAWKKLFCPGVTRCDIVEGRSVPVEGSVGISFSIHEDLGALWATLGGDTHAIATYLETNIVCGTTPGFEGQPKPITACQVSQVLSFMEFAMGDQPYFFLRKGRKTYGLYRKTRNYFYDPTEDLCHRIGFAFVRFATKEEQAGFRLGAVPLTVMMVKAHIHEPTLDEVLASLTRVRSAVANLAADLDTAFSRFHKALQ